MLPATGVAGVLIFKSKRQITVTGRDDTKLQKMMHCVSHIPAHQTLQRKVDFQLKLKTAGCICVARRMAAYDIDTGGVVAGGKFRRATKGRMSR